jgi:putative addiction module CopG family antidote
MSVTLTPEHEAEVAERVASGRYPSSESVIGEALAALGEKEARAALVADIQAGVASLDAGLGEPLTRDTIEAIKAAGRERLANRAGASRG